MLVFVGKSISLDKMLIRNCKQNKDFFFSKQFKIVFYNNFLIFFSVDWRQYFRVKNSLQV